MSTGETKRDEVGIIEKKSQALARKGERGKGITRFQFARPTTDTKIFSTTEDSLWATVQSIDSTLMSCER